MLIRSAKAASRQIKDLEPWIEKLLNASVTDNTLSAERISKVQTYAEAADDRYLNEQEQGAPESVWRNWFAKARLGAAIAGAFTAKNQENLADAVYELCFTSDDKQTTIALLESEISARMPRISEFHGVAIYMYYRDHSPPHFHAIHSGDEMTVEIATVAMDSAAIMTSR